MTLRDVLSLEAAIGLALSLAFIGRYLAVRDWWRTEAGRHMMTATVVLGMVLGLLLTGPWPLLAWVVALGALDAVLAGQLLLLVRAQRRRRAEQHADRGSS